MVCVTENGRVVVGFNRFNRSAEAGGGDGWEEGVCVQPDKVQKLLRAAQLQVLTLLPLLV